MITKETIDKIFSTARVEEIIAEFISLKKAGSNYKGLSPFVEEKTPSFMVSPSKQIWKDFSSGKGGNVVTFLMEHEQFTYPEALRYLAKRYNIEIEEEKELTENQKEHKQVKESLYHISEAANNFFIDQLWNSEEGTTIGISYFEERNFTHEIIRKFQLGYSGGKDSFSKYAISKGYKEEILEESGLSIKRENGDLIDRFRGRVIFPIHSFSGRILGFGGRIMQNFNKTAKYLNSPESSIYHKSQILYGLFQAKSSIIKEDNCYLVEGYTDVISFHQKGIENVVASSGTSLTNDQIRLIKRLTNNITIIFDGDSAGIKASFRGIDLILKQELNIRVLLLPEGEDPDSFSKKLSIYELKEYITNNTTDFIQFKTKVLLKEVENDPIKKAALINEIVESIALVRNLIQRELYVKECSHLLNISESVLFKELAQIENRNLFKDRKSVKRNSKVQDQLLNIEEAAKESILDPCILLEKDLIYLIMNYGNKKVTISYNEEEPYEITIIEEIIYQLKENDIKFKHDLYAEVVDEIEKGISGGELRSGLYFSQHKNQKFVSLASDAQAENEKYALNDWASQEIHVEDKDQNLTQDVKDTILRYQNLRIKDWISELLNKIEINQGNREENLAKIYRLRLLSCQLNEMLNRVL